MNPITSINGSREARAFRRRRPGNLDRAEPALGHYNLIGVWHPGAAADCARWGCRGHAG